MNFAHDIDAPPPPRHTAAAGRPAATPRGASLLEQALVYPQTTLHAVIERFTTG